MIRLRFALTLLASSLLAFASLAVAAPPGSDSRSGPPAWTVDDLFASPTPFALGHRGYGENAGEDPNRPIQNTLDAFQQAFHDGIRVVELDLQLTADDQVVVYHDDFLSDYTCIRALTYQQLLERQPQVPLFSRVLHSLRHFGNGHQRSGTLFAEIKVPAPLCDGANTSAEAEVSERHLVALVVAEVRAARMEDRVILNAGSPTILRHVAQQAPHIARAFTLNALQLLTPEQVAGIVHLPVTRIPKNDFGLEWYNIGPIARLPRIPSIPGFIGLSLATGSRAVSVDKLVLMQAGASAPAVVAGFHGAGLEVVTWTIGNRAEWDFVADAGSDGITTNDIALGLAGQARVPRDRGRRDGAVGEIAAGLSLARGASSADGAVAVDFTLRSFEPAHMRLFDVTGRLADSREVGGQGPGRHTVALGRALAPGMYLVELRQEEAAARLKTIVLR